MAHQAHTFCGRVNRRGFLSGLGMGFGSLAAGSMLSPAAQATSKPARAKNVIWIFSVRWRESSGNV